MINKITQVYFSPNHSTKRITQTLAKCFEGSKKRIDLLQVKKLNQREFTDEDLVIFGMPVFAGRIPQTCPESLVQLKGNNTPAIILVTYGNREYDDALLELYDSVTSNGFKVIGAGAFVAQHSLFTSVAKERPDTLDEKAIQQFGAECQEKLEENENHFVPRENIKGNFPYKETGNIPLKPKGDQKCTKCNACVQICPTGAIDIMNPCLTDEEKCISCTACMKICPVNSRGFHGKDKFKKNAGQIIFKYKNRAKKENEWTVI